MFIPDRMAVDRSPGYGELHTITCNNCDAHSRPLDLIANEQQARAWISGHRCDSED